jgi:hypothetical protein
MKSLYQGGAIMILSIYLFENSFVNIVGITFTALILSEVRKGRKRATKNDSYRFPLFSFSLSSSIAVECCI